MLELTGELWEFHARGEIVAITTGGLVGKSGACAMPRGCAAQAREKFPGLDRVLGTLINLHGNHVHDLGNRILSFPVENSPYENPDMHLIRRSCYELVSLVDRCRWSRVIVPRPGCGAGGLEWNEVRKVLVRIFDERFHVINQERA